MRGRGILAKVGLVLGSGVALAQPPGYPQPPLLPQPPAPLQPPSFPSAPSFPAPQFPVAPVPPPGLLPQMQPAGPAASPTGAVSPGPNPLAMPQEIPLPQKENKIAFNATEVGVKRVANGWQLWAGRKVLRDFGDNESNARDTAIVMRDLRPTEWVTIGGPKPIVEYGLVNGRPPMTAGVPGAATENRKDVFQAGGFNGPAATGAGAKAVVPIDLKTVRVEPIRGVWCVRDDASIHFNFGPNKADAEQAVAVVRRYGFNRVGIVGAPVPVMNYLFASPDNVAAAAPQTPLAKLQLQSQIDGLTRVGIPIGGVGFTGEMVPFDARKLDVRKEGNEWVVAAGTEVFGRFGPTEWGARDAARIIQQARFTEFCKVGSAGHTFFLANGKAPTRVPLIVQGKQFDLNAVKVQKNGEKWAVTENGRHLLDCANADEGETLVRLLKHYQFDQICHLGPTPKLGVSFLAKAGH